MFNSEVYNTLERKRVFLPSKLGAVLNTNIDNINYNQILDNLKANQSFTNINLFNDNEKVYGDIEFNEKLYNIKICYIETNNTDEYRQNIDFLSSMNDLDNDEIERWKNSKLTILLEMDFNDFVDECYFVQLKILDSISKEYIVVFDMNSQRVFSSKWVKLLLKDNLLPLNSDLFTIHISKDDKNNDIWLHTHGLQRCGCIELEMMGLTRESSANFKILNTLAIKIIEEGTPSKNYEMIAGYSGESCLKYVWKPWEEAIKFYSSKKFLGCLEDRDESHSHPSGVLFALKNNKIQNPLSYSLLLKGKIDYVYPERENLKFCTNAKVRIKYLKKIFEEQGNNFQYFIKAKISNGDKNFVWFKITEISYQKILGSLIIENNEEKVYTINENDIFSWQIYTDKGVISQDNIYKYL